MDQIQPPGRDAGLATLGGLGAVLLWSTTVAFARSLSEALGPLTGAAAVYAVSGALGLISLLLDREKRRRLFRLPVRYLAGCGALFIGYMLMLYLAIGLAGDRQQVLEVGLLNYLWPTLTLVLSPVFLHKKADWLLIPGTALALSGVLLVLTQGTRISWQSVSRNVDANPLAYALALGAAVSWATYSNLARRWAGGTREGAVALFLPTAGVVLLAISLFVDEPRTWSPRAILEALFLGVASYIAYDLWDNAMRKGNVTMVAAASYLTPFFSIVVSLLYLAVVPDRQLWIGCALLILGSILSRRSVSDIANPGASQANID